MSGSDVFGLLALCVVSSFGGILIGSSVQYDAGKTKFIRYCTDKGEKYDACEEIWRTGARHT